MFAGTGELAFQPPGIADATFGVINKTKQIRTTSTAAVTFAVCTYLIREILRAQTGPRFLHDDGEAILVEE